MKRAALLLAMSVGAAASPALAHPARQSTESDWDMMAFEMKSWGEPVTSWRIMADGQGSWTETVRETPDAPMGEYSLAWHEVTAGKGGFARLSAILSGLPDPAPAYRGCKSAITDQPYGTLRLTRGATTTEISYNAGCLDDDYVAFLDVLKAANLQVEEWGKAGKVLRTEKP
ncbi:MAG: hypothetical protein KDE32_10250 [Novosphingobium sp.]|nr:hypothetical protein [Novosphingobium sp.]